MLTDAAYTVAQEDAEAERDVYASRLQSIEKYCQDLDSHSPSEEVEALIQRIVDIVNYEPDDVRKG